MALVEITGRWSKVKLQKTPTKQSHRMFCILLKKVIKNHRCWIKKSNSVFFIHWEGLSFFSKPRHSNKHCLTELSLFCCTLFVNIYDFIILSSFVKCSQRVSLFLRVCLQLWTKACMHVIFWFERRTRDACTLFLVERSILLGFWSITVCLPNLLTRDVFTVAYKTPFKKHF